MAVTKEMNAQQDRQKALENAMKQITKEFGAGSIMRLGEMGDKLDIEVIPTGSLALDIAVGVGGYPRGRVIEIYGPESSGKTTLALHAIAEAQKMGGVTAFIDAEHALDPVYAHHLGVDTKELLISQPDSGEQALSIAESLVRSGAVDMIVIDSVAALVPKQEIEGDISDASVGLQARLMSKALRKLTGIISKSKTIVIFINQLREKVGVMFGNPETTTGGRALKFYSSIRIEIRKLEVIKNGSDDNGRIIVQAADAAGNLDAVHIRQPPVDDIGVVDIAHLDGLPRTQHRFLAGKGPLGAHAHLDQHLCHAVAGVEVVIHHQCLQALQLGDLFHRAVLRLRAHRHTDDKLASFALRRLHFDGAAHHIHNVFGNRHTKTGALYLTYR